MAGVPVSPSLLHTLITTLVLMIFAYCATNACNIDERSDSIRRLNGDPGSYFGYTVLQHRNTFGLSVLVGAPRGQSRYQLTIDRPGALYNCAAVSPFTCDEEDLGEIDGNENSESEQIKEVKDNQWLGVSLTRQTNLDRAGAVTICGHLWANDYHVQGDPIGADRYPNGVCYTIDADFDVQNVVKFRPCLEEVQVQKKTINDTYKVHGYCQAGISATYTMDGTRLILGAVGSYEWNGTTITADKDNGAYTFNVGNTSRWGMGKKRETEYIGYSVSSGRFLSTDTEQGVTGAPRSKEIGQVFIYDLETFEVYAQFQGEMMNTYYGGAVLAVDVNNDGLSDLLVGAPLYSVRQDEGRVYVYINKGEGRLEQMDFKLEGSNAIGGRFGSTIAFIGDINLDGFYDVAIAAPYEDENTGVVYIYQGHSNGVRRYPSQRLAARDLLPGIRSFGSSLTGGLDMDYNFYPDIVVGAYANDAAFIFKTLPIVNVRVWIVVEPDTLDPEFNNCELPNGGPKITCLKVSVCFDYTKDLGLPDEIKFDYNLEADTIKSDISATSRLFFLNDGGDKTTSVAETVELTTSMVNCSPRRVYLEDETRDFLTPLRFVLQYNVFKYPVIDDRGDTAGSPFAGGLAPVLGNADCSNGTVEKTVRFVQACGNDSICQTDLQVTAELSVSSANNYITLGADAVVYLMMQVDNVGEEAHQAELLITHSREVVFESLEMRRVECLEDNSVAEIAMDQPGELTSCLQDTVVTCEPRESRNETAVVYCLLGNPMRSQTRNILRMRFDIGAVPSSRRSVDFTTKASTLSLQDNSTLHDNTAVVSMPIKVVADITVRGVVKPEQVFYTSNNTIDGMTKESSALLRQSLVAAGIVEGDSVDETLTETQAIGPKFTNIYEISNMGPGRLPFDLAITISLPWRTVEGDWLIYVKDIQLQGQSGSCDTANVLSAQEEELRSYYLDPTGTVTYTPRDEALNRDVRCEEAWCVEIHCYLKGPMLRSSGAVISIDALLWQRTLIDTSSGSVDIISTATVGLRDIGLELTQPDDHAPDTVELRTILFTEVTPNKPVEAWIIAVSTIGGVIGFIVAVLAMWKLGFFKRDAKEKLDQAMEIANPTAL